MTRVIARRGLTVRRPLDLPRLEALAAITLLSASVAAAILQQSKVDEEAGAAVRAGSRIEDALRTAPATTTIAAYGGVPYTYPSDVVIQRPGVHDLTLEKVGWDGKPFKSPIYYGVRVARGSDASPLGGMIDFTHSKAISRFDETVRLRGTLYGEKAPETARIGALFRHLEFSHGHNMLTLNALFRLPRIAARLVPYVGLGAGASFPHTEIAFHKDDARTYEYQYTGPVGQALAGVEIRIGRQSYFVEYKFTLAAYTAPLTGEDGGLAIADVWRQLGRWLSGAAPAHGFARARLVSHQLIAGLGVRLGAPAR
jgi:hypothetical protein